MPVSGANGVREKLIAIGAGMAGGRVVEELVVRDGNRFDITIVGAEPYAVYNRILLSDVLAGSKSAEGNYCQMLWIGRARSGGLPRLIPS
jgi:nitrite reductase (NADH) large subunit